MSDIELISDITVIDVTTDVTSIDIETSTATIDVGVDASVIELNVDSSPIELDITSGLIGPQGPAGDSAVESAQYTYDVDGQLVLKVTATGTSTFVYEDGLLSSVIGTGSHQSKAFTYDPDGNITAVDVS